MKKGIASKKIAAYAIICGSLFVWRPAHAFIWPVIDLTEVTSFAQTIANGIGQVSNATSQLQEINKTITMVGEQVASVKKYATDLKGTITNIKDTVTRTISDAKDTLNNLEERAEEVDAMLNGATEKEKENAENLVNSVNEQVDAGAVEEEVQETIDTAQEESEAIRQNVNESLDEASQEINDSLNKVNSELDIMMATVDGNEKLDEEKKEELNKEADTIKKDIEDLKEKSTAIITEAKENYNEQHSKKVAEALDSYSQAVSDFYAGKITREDLTKAGEDFKQSVASLEAGIDETLIDDLVNEAQGIADRLGDLSESILDASSDTGDYSDGSEKTSSLWKKKATKNYAFNFHSEHSTALLTGIFSETDGSFLLPAELACDNLDVGEIGESPGDLRECVIKAKGDPELYPNLYDDQLYAPYKKNGVYKHLLEDYSMANIANTSRAKQNAATWSALEPDDDSNKGTLYMLRKTLKDVDNTRSAISLMSMTDIEAPKLWSEIRRVDALSRAKNMIKDFTEGLELYLDGRDSEYATATNQNWGTMQSSDLDSEETDYGVKDKAIFSNVILSICDLHAKDISVSAKNKYNASLITEKEQNLADCLFKYAEGASRGTIDGKASEGGGEFGKRIWRNRQMKAYNDSAFNNLTLAIINNYKSSLDYANPEQLPNADDENIVTMQKGIKESTTARDDYSAGAQMNYYTTLQILSIIDADAQNQQTGILKDLMTFDYNYFGQSTAGES